jgi:hypothetical protein
MISKFKKNVKLNVKKPSVFLEGFLLNSCHYSVVDVTVDFMIILHFISSNKYVRFDFNFSTVKKDTKNYPGILKIRDFLFKFLSRIK